MPMDTSGWMHDRLLRKGSSVFGYMGWEVGEGKSMTTYSGGQGLC